MYGLLTGQALFLLRRHTRKAYAVNSCTESIVRPLYELNEVPLWTVFYNLKGLYLLSCCCVVPAVEWAGESMETPRLRSWMLERQLNLKEGELVSLTHFVSVLRDSTQTTHFRCCYFVKSTLDGTRESLRICAFLCFMNWLHIITSMTEETLSSYFVHGDS